MNEKTLSTPHLHAVAAPNDGWKMLLYKEVLRFWRVAFQTIAAPVVSKPHSVARTPRKNRLISSLQVLWGPLARHCRHACQASIIVGRRGEPLRDHTMTKMSSLGKRIANRAAHGVHCILRTNASDSPCVRGTVYLNIAS